MARTKGQYSAHNAWIDGRNEPNRPFYVQPGPDPAHTCIRQARAEDEPEHGEHAYSQSDKSTSTTQFQLEKSSLIFSLFPLLRLALVHSVGPSLPRIQSTNNPTS